ncbi:RICIN domain-containing protein [Streptomyces sp. NRRL S-448]|uniref:RICIN domain-containing protein n=1 Tax=Streptomyces sp. NRRL S-448 TaxID=1463907 RepID=UPI003566BEF0
MTASSGVPSAPSPRLIALLAAAFLALAVSLSPLPAGQAHAATCTFTSSNLDCLSFVAINGRNIDVEGASTSDGARIVTLDSGRPATRNTAKWRFNVNQDNTFQIINSGTGKCIDVGWGDDGLRQWTCQGQATQRWAIQPTSIGWRMRHINSGKCMDLLNRSDYDNAWVGLYNCHSGDNQMFFFVGSNPADQAKALAVKYAADRCQTQTWSCYWTEESESEAAPLPTKCISTQWYNPYDNPYNYTFTVSTAKGFNSTLGVTVTAGFETGALSSVVAKVTSSLSVANEFTWTSSTTTTNSVTLSAQPHKYNWVARAVQAKTVTGTFTFDADGFPWEANDKITVPLKGGSNDPVFYSPMSTATPASGCSAL